MIFKKLQFVLFAAAFILLVLAPSPLSAASADDFQITYHWTSGNNAEAQIETFQPSNTSTLTYLITEKNSTSQMYFIANVTDVGGEPKPGFNITVYPKANLVSGGQTVAEITNPSYDRDNGTLIIPLTNTAEFFSIDLTIESDASTVYHDETNKITAGLYVLEDSVYVPISNEVVSTANNKYPQLISSLQFSLLNPSLMPSGEAEIDVKYNLMTGNEWNILLNRNFRVMYDSFTINFSDVSITADGVTKTYSQWLNDGNSPVQFKTGTNTNYTLSPDGLSITYVPSANDYLQYNKRFEFSIHTTDDFKSNGSIAPAINFTNSNISGDMKINDRGPSVQFTNVGNGSANNPTYLLPNYKPGTTVLTGTQTDHLSVTLTHSSPSQWVVSNSESYDPLSPFYYQELFKTIVKNKVRDGTNEILSFSVPEGITVTHIRAPKVANERAVYGKISILKDDKTYTLDPAVSKTYDLSALKAVEDGTPLKPYDSGEAVVLKIDKLLLIEKSIESIYSYSADYTITFIGTTRIDSGNNYHFNVSRPGVPGLLNDIQFRAVTDYIVSPGLKNSVRYLTNSATSYTTSPDHVDRGDTFYMFSQFNASPHPYGSAVRVSPIDTTGLYSNPVLYFSVPPGLEIGDASITSSDGADIIASGAFKDYSGQTLNITQTEIPNAGVYAAQGGTLVEVKIHLNEAGKEGDTFWIDSALNCFARLPVTVSQEYTENLFDFHKNSALISSWDPIANSSISGGAYGANYAFTADFDQAAAYLNKNGSYNPYLTDEKVHVQSEPTVISSVGVGVDSGYVYYNPNSGDAYPTLKAGSQNEMFKVYFYNGLGETVGTDQNPATLYFLLPVRNDIWRAILTDAASLDITESGNIDQYSISYATDDFSSDIGSLTLEEADDLDWTVITNIEDTDDVDWANVTAIKCEIYEAEDKSRLELLLPFKLPQVGSGLDESEKKAIGRTLYDVYVNENFSLSNDNGYTAAIMLSTESDRPEIFTRTPIPQGASFVYKTGALPEWYNVSTRDDFTADVGIADATIVFRDLNGVNTTLFSGDVSELFNRSPLPASLGYAAGYNYTINASAANPVTNDRVGNYTITYTTTADADGEVAELTLRFQIQKASSTIVLDIPVEQEIFMNEEVQPPAETWIEHFRKFVSGNDTGVPIPNEQFIYNASVSTLDTTVPGSYSAVYDYTDIGLNPKSSTVPVIVKYADELIVNAIAAGSPVTNLTVTIASDGKSNPSVTYNDDKNGYNASIQAVKATNTIIDYTITYSDVPAGLIDDTGSPATDSATYGDASPVVYDLEFTPAKFTVELENAANIKNVALYKVNEGEGGDSCLETVTLSGDETSLTFDKDVGWFEDGQYYFAAELVRGYTSSAEDNFYEVVEDSPFYVKTENMPFEHADIVLSLTAEEAPFISGSVWNDANGDSVMDDTESGISSVTVNLLDSDLNVIRSTTTAEDGSYDFVEFGEKTEVYIQVNMPAGFNRVSAYQGDQNINGSNNYLSKLFDFASVKHHADINAGFYSVSTGGGGGGTGGATIIDPTTPANGAETIGGLEEELGFSGDQDPEPEIIQKSRWSWWWLWLLLLLLLAAAYYYYKKNKKNKNK